MVPEKDTLEYIKYLIEKATPASDAPMVVDWIPHVQRLIEKIEVLTEEYEILRHDYEVLKTRRMREVWRQQQSQGSSDS
jgi:hypothetical protein